MNRHLIHTIVVVFFILQFSVFAEDEVNTETLKADEVIEADIVDFFSLRNPFMSQLPKVEIIKTPIELPKQTINNDMSQMFPQVIPPEVVIQPVVLPTFEIQGMIYDVKDPLVIIDDQTFGIGESVKGATIKVINKNGVKFLFSGKEFNVNLEM